MPAFSDTQKINRALIQYIVRQVQAEAAGLGVPIWIYVAGDHNPPSATEDQQALPAEQVPFMLLQFNGGKAH